MISGGFPGNGKLSDSTVSGNGDTPGDGDTLGGLIIAERDLADKAMSYTREQTELLRREALDAFDKSLRTRNGVLGELENVRAEIMRRAKAGERFSPEHSRTRDGTLETLRECQKQSEANARTLKNMMAELSRAINNLDERKSGIGGYAAAIAQPPEMFDHRM